MNKNAYAARQCATYFQIPLCALAFGKSDNERLNAIIHFGWVETGRKHWRKLPVEARHRFIDKQKWDYPGHDFDSGLDAHCFALYGASLMSIQLGSIRYCLARHAELQNFTNAFQKRHGSDTLVRLKSSLVLEAHAGKGITLSEVSVLAAIYSVIGRKQGPVRITQNRISWRALGYKTQAVMSAELPKRKDGAEPLTDWQIRSLLDRLQARRFFARATYGRRLSYYSHRMTENQLRKAVIEMKTHRFASQRLRRLDDHAMTDAIRNQRASLAGRPPSVPNAKPFQT